MFAILRKDVEKDLCK